MSRETGFERWLDRFEAPERTVYTVNRTHPDPVQNLLADSFANQPVEVGDVDTPADAENVVVVVEDGDVIATSPLDALMNAFLTINTDSYRTSTAGFADDDIPEVLTALDETVFDVRGYPASNKEKLLLTIISRHVERRALDVGAGTIRSLFQRLSRIDDERGTREVYDSLTDTDLDVHVYGTPGPDDPGNPNLIVHEGASVPYRDSWCVVFRPPEGESGHAALVAVRTGDNVWEGAWTYDPEYVEAIDDYVATL